MLLFNYPILEALPPGRLRYDDGGLALAQTSKGTKRPRGMLIRRPERETLASDVALSFSPSRYTPDTAFSVITFYQDLKTVENHLHSYLPFCHFRDSSSLCVRFVPSEVCVCLIRFRVTAQRNGNNGIRLTGLELLPRMKVQNEND